MLSEHGYRAVNICSSVKVRCNNLGFPCLPINIIELTYVEGAWLSDGGVVQLVA